MLICLLPQIFSDIDFAGRNSGLVISACRCYRYDRRPRSEYTEELSFLCEPVLCILSGLVDSVWSRLVDGNKRVRYVLIARHL